MIRRMRFSLDDMPRNFRDLTSDEVLAWLRRERIFFSLAVREWEAHEAEYASGARNLNHFLEQVAKGLPRSAPVFLVYLTSRVGSTPLCLRGPCGNRVDSCAALLFRRG